MAHVHTEEELGEALKRGENSIIIEGELAGKVIRIRAVGGVAWVIAYGSIGIAIASVLLALPSGGTSSFGLVAAPAALGILGGTGTATAIGIGIAAGGVAALNKLRGYKEVSRHKGRLHLRRGS